VLGACGDDDNDADEPPEPEDQAPTSSPPASTSTAQEEVRSLEEMVGQMLMLGFRGLVLEDDNPIVADLGERHVGGAILFSYDVPSDSPVRNIESPEQVAALTEALREAGGDDLLLAIDQEGGRVARLGPDHGFPDTSRPPSSAPRMTLRPPRRQARISPTRS
jgi:beta-N-acetylhexosaminidase